jgi:hypothetical protein
MQETTDASVVEGKLPLSIIIIEIGSAGFAAIDLVNADDLPLHHRARYTVCQDLAQITPYNTFAGTHYSSLPQDVPDEVPRQISEWAETNKFVSIDR